MIRPFIENTCRLITVFFIKMSSSFVSHFDSSLNLQKSYNSYHKKNMCPELGSKIIKICHKYNDISLETIEYKFHSEFLYPLIPIKEGFESIEELIENLIRDNYPIEWQRNRDDTQCLRTTRDYFRWLSVIKCDRKYHLMDILCDCAEDIISCGQELPQLKFPNDCPLNKFPKYVSVKSINDLNFIDVRIMCARSPHELYLNICGEEYHNSYHKLRNEMQFYDRKENQNKYCIPSLLLFEGLLCAVKYPKICDEWHRSQLLNIDKQNNCRLFLVDIGDIFETNAKNLRLLRKSFAELPPQAIKVQLFGVRPKSSQKWSNWARNMVIPLEDNNYCGPIKCAFGNYRKDRYRVCLKYYDRIRSNNLNDLIFLHKILIDKQLAVTSRNDKPFD